MDHIADQADSKPAANRHRPRRADPGGDQAEGEAAHGAESAIDQTEHRHDAAAVMLAGVELQKRGDRRQECRLEAAGDEQEHQRQWKAA